MATTSTSTSTTRFHRFWLTFLLFFGSFAYGLTSYILGPAINEFRTRLHTDLAHLSIALSLVGIFYTLGALINGFLFSHLNRQILFATLLFIGGIVITVAPHITQLWNIYVITVVAGFVCGGFDTANLVWMVELWTDDPYLYLLAVQFFFSIGTFVSPLLSRPFLSRNETITCVPPEPNCLNGTMEVATESHIEIPFSIVGGILFISGLMMLATHFVRRYRPPKSLAEQVATPLTTFKIVTIILAILQIGPYIGMEISNFQLLPTYAGHSYLKLDDQQSAVTQSIMAGTFALARGLLILVAKVVPEHILLPVHYLIIFTSNTLIFLCDTFEWPKWIFWLSQACLGIGFSSVIGSTYSYVEKFIEINDLIGGLFVCSGGTMIALYVGVCGSLIEEHSMILYWFNYGTVILLSLAFTAFTYMQRAANG